MCYKIRVTVIATGEYWFYEGPYSEQGAREFVTSMVGLLPDIRFTYERIEPIVTTKVSDLHYFDEDPS